jgi:predicted DNA-binding transcriptional regulator AlpA
MKPRKILRRKEAHSRLGVGHSKFFEDFLLRDPADPFVPGTEIPRLKPIHLGPRNVGFLEHEVDELIGKLAAVGGTRSSVAAKRNAAKRAAKRNQRDAEPAEVSGKPNVGRGKHSKREQPAA